MTTSIGVTACFLVQLYDCGHVKHATYTVSRRRSEGACAKELDIVADGEVGHFRLFGSHDECRSIAESACSKAVLHCVECAFVVFYVFRWNDDVVTHVP